MTERRLLELVVALAMAGSSSSGVPFPIRRLNRAAFSIELRQGSLTCSYGQAQGCVRNTKFITTRVSVSVCTVP
jgi:hypothetical protein